ncbi:hypothetical protein TNCV_1917841 [Trichonephila clavipes]|uniref:Uncharacterized protein n=1 Tax=Trichonephila clavipes TaxID=2585209 RepID=A0A8X6W0V0_TRICX|nr:hypothetical protein TNCV_1917841 [Trichonephila clavipes]
MPCATEAGASSVVPARISSQSSRHYCKSPLPHASALIQRDFGCVLGVQQTKQLPHVAKVDLVWKPGKTSLVVHNLFSVLSPRCLQTRIIRPLWCCRQMRDSSVKTTSFHSATHILLSSHHRRRRRLCFCVKGKPSNGRLADRPLCCKRQMIRADNE